MNGYLGEIEEEREAKLAALRADIAVAQEQVQRGEVVETTAEAFLARKRNGSGYVRCQSRSHRPSG